MIGNREDCEKIQARVAIWVAPATWVITWVVAFKRGVKILFQTIEGLRRLECHDGQLRQARAGEQYEGILGNRNI